MFQKIEGLEKGLVTAVDDTDGVLTATLLAGPSILVPFLGFAPAVGQPAWFLEVASGSWMCLGAITQPGWGGPWGAPWGTWAEQKVTSSQDIASASLTDITSAAVTFNAVANRYYRLIAQLPKAGVITTAGVGTVSIQTGASGAGTVLYEGSNGTGGTTGNWPIALSSPRLTFSAGTQSIHLRASASAGAFRTNGAATSPVLLQVDDVGPAIN